MKHKHYDMIVAWAEGKNIQFKAFSHSEWEDVDMHGEEWYEHYTYRIKPESVPDEVQEFLALRTTFVSGSIMKNLRLTFDGESGKLKSAEVLQ